MTDQRHTSGTLLRRKCLACFRWLVLAIIVNIAVTWLIALFYPRTIIRTAPDTMFAGNVDGIVGRLEDGRILDAHYIYRPLWIDVEISALSYGPIRGPLDALPAWAKPGTTGISYLQKQGAWLLDQQAYGFPLPSMRGSYVWHMISDEHVPMHDGFVIDVPWYTNSKREPPTRVIPFRPIWWAFAINVVFYILLLFGMRLAYRTVRSRYHMARGRCIKCGYSQTGLDEPGCPECGWKREPKA